MQTHVIYMIGAYRKDSAAPDAIKIGIASDVDNRLYELQTGNHLRLRIMATWKTASFKKARHIENCAHKRFKRSRMNREWFEPHTKAFIDYLNTICAEQMSAERKEELKAAANEQRQAMEDAAAVALDMEARAQLSWLRH